MNRQSAILLAGGLLCVVCLGVGGWLLFRSVSLVAPGPALLMFACATLALAGSYALSRILVAAQPVDPPLADEPKTRHQPRRVVQGAEVLINRWLARRPSLSHEDGEMIYHQLQIAEQILDEPDVQTLRFIHAFEGNKPEKGVFLVRANARPVRVLKFDRIENMRWERDRFDRYVSGRLAQHTPGKPDRYWPPPDEWDSVEPYTLGAVVYDLAQMGDSGVQTFGHYYQTHGPAEVCVALEELIARLNKGWWHDHKPPQATLFTEYSRLARNNKTIQAAWAAVVSRLGALAPTHDSETGDLLISGPTAAKQVGTQWQQHPPPLRLPDPLTWLERVFADQAAFTTALGDLEPIRRDSVIHGDFHAGNVLVEPGKNGSLHIWLIDFPHTHIGPTVRDIARLEADILFALLPLESRSCYDLIHLAQLWLPPSGQTIQPLAALSPVPLPTEADAEIRKASEAIALLRGAARRWMSGDDARPYYLALLHAALPMLAYHDRSDSQKLCAYLTAALLCSYLSA